MTEVMGKDGTWSFDGDTVRIVPGSDKNVNKIRVALGEITVPLEAISGVAFEPTPAGSKAARETTGRLRLRLRGGVDPFWQACGGRLPDDADPYQLAVGTDRGGVAEYFSDAVRDALTVAEIPSELTDRYLLAAPAVPVTANGQDGTGTFDGEVVRLDWNWLADLKKQNVGPRRFALAELESVEWRPAVGLDWGWIRFRTKGATVIASENPRLDPYCLTLWGTKKESGASALLAAAIVGRMPHPAAAPLELEAAADVAEAAPDDHDTQLRRLRELGELHRDGVLTDEEFAAAKQAVLRRM